MHAVSIHEGFHSIADVDPGNGPDTLRDDPDVDVNQYGGRYRWYSVCI